jgi:hypothetical protein
VSGRPVEPRELRLQDVEVGHCLLVREACPRGRGLREGVDLLLSCGQVLLRLDLVDGDLDLRVLDVVELVREALRVVGVQPHRLSGADQIRMRVDEYAVRGVLALPLLERCC